MSTEAILYAKLCDYFWFRRLEAWFDGSYFGKYYVILGVFVLGWSWAAWTYNF